MMFKKLYMGLIISFGLMVNGLYALTINNNTTLSGTYNEDVNITGGVVSIGNEVNITGTLYMSGGFISIDATGNESNNILNIHGNFQQFGGSLTVGGGKLYVDGNYTITGNSYFNMGNSPGHVAVNGDFTMASNYSHQNRLKDGILIVKGNFTQSTMASGENFYSSLEHKVVLSGNTAQHVYFDSPTSSLFTTLEINNTSEDGVDLGEVKIVGNLITTTSNIYNLSLHAQGTSWTNNVTIDGGMRLMSGNIYFDNNQTVTMNDDVVIDGTGVLYLNNSTFVINGDLNQTGDGRLDSVSGEMLVDGNYTIAGNGTLDMQQPDTNITVNGDFTMASNINHSSYFQYGTLTVKGDFTQSGHAESFNGDPNHKVILSGNTVQQVSFASITSRFGDLQIDNTSVEGIVFQTATTVQDTLYATSCQVRLNLDNVMYGTLDLDGSCTPLSLLVADQTSYFATDAGIIGERTYNTDGNYTGSLTLADGSSFDVNGTYSSVGDVLTLNRTSPSSRTLVLTYLGEDAGVTSFSVLVDGGASISYSYPTAEERDTAVANAVLLTMVDTTRYFLNSKGAIGQRTYAEDGTYTGSIIFANGNKIDVTGNYEIVDDQIIVDRETPSVFHTELTYLNTDAGVTYFDVSVNYEAEVFQSSSYATKEERDAALPNGINPALIMYLLN